MAWLGILDSNQDYLIQSQAGYRYPNPQWTRWRRGWDSNPRWLLTTPLFESGTLNHSDTSPEQGGDPNGIRTRVSAVRGRYPRPLDDGASIGGPRRTRTYNLPIKSRMLYH